MFPLSVRSKTAVSISIITTLLRTHWTKSCRKNWRRIPQSSQSLLMLLQTWSSRCLVEVRLKLACAFAIGLFAAVLCPSLQGKEAISKADNFVTVYGAKIHYVEAGTGAPLILIHGLADDVGIWDSIIPALSTKFRVIALDQIGFGRSDKPLLNYRVGTFVDFLDVFFTDIKIYR